MSAPEFWLGALFGAVVLAVALICFVQWASAPMKDDK